MVKGQIRITDRAMILIIAAIIIIAVVVSFFSVGVFQTPADKTTFLITLALILFLIFVLYKTIKYFSIKFSIRFQN